MACPELPEEQHILGGRGKWDPVGTDQVLVLQMFGVGEREVRTCEALVVTRPALASNHLNKIRTPNRKFREAGKGRE